MPRFLITGCSSDFGRAIAARLLDQGGTVIATMRSPSVAGLSETDRMQLLVLGVTAKTPALLPAMPR
jgi:NAD(P)-dependent dehydrogenase (short-subunit alcohol dehydrogenase family)